MYLDEIYVLWKKIGTRPSAPLEKSAKERLSKYSILLNLRSFWLISLLYLIFGCSESIDKIVVCPIETFFSSKGQTVHETRLKCQAYTQDSFHY